MSPAKSHPSDRVTTRGHRGPSPLGTSLFVGLRLLDGLILQRALQVLDPISSLHRLLGLIPPPPPPSGGPVLATSTHNLTPNQTILWSMAIGSAAKQIIWVLFISLEPIPPSTAVAVSVFNTLVNSLNTLSFSYAAANPSYIPRDSLMTRVALPLYTAGILIELISESQRAVFKSRPENDGKPYSGGLFGYARSINYFGYTLWRTGFALAGGGWIWAAVTAGFFTWDFVARGIPMLEAYCRERYGRQWEEVEKRVTWRFCPGIY